ncbi:MAG: patatin-like phospholipase family protein [Rhizobiales bacterium]|nr:patatin-like phospholipase family protein [Hyphomicrobiales bacterium]
MHAWGRLVAAIGVVALSGCTSVYNVPQNQPLTGPVQAASLGSELPLNSDDVMLSLAFSGGGTRAAAFSFGVLKELDTMRIRDRGKAVSLLDRVDFVSGVSGGSVLAAYYGLRRRDALADFRERFLLRNAEESLNTRVSLINLGRALGGGLNDATHLPRWLDENLFGGATFREFRRDQRPRIWINASDIYNRTPFVFGSVAFDAMCSDLLSYPISEAVAASAAVPVVFAPIVLETFPGRCQTKLPDWIVRARANRNAQPLLRDFAQAIESYHTGSMRYVKLLDGGLVDNFGLSGFSIALLSATRPYEPMTPRQAVRIRRMFFLIVDSGRAPSGNWAQQLPGPTGVELVMATADTATEANTRASYAAFGALMNEWVGKVRRWRCGLSAAERQRLGVGPNWRCDDVNVFVERVGFDQFDRTRAEALDAIPTRFYLPQQSVDFLIEAGREAVRNNSIYRAFRRGL